MSVNNIKTIKFIFLLLLSFSRDSRDMKSSLRGGGHVRERMSDLCLDWCLFASWRPAFWEVTRFPPFPFQQHKSSEVNSGAVSPASTQEKGYGGLLSRIPAVRNTCPALFFLGFHRLTEHNFSYWCVFMQHPKSTRFSPQPLPLPLQEWTLWDWTCCSHAFLSSMGETQGSSPSKSCQVMRTWPARCAARADILRFLGNVSSN